MLTIKAVEGYRLKVEGFSPPLPCSLSPLLLFKTSFPNAERLRLTPAPDLVEQHGDNNHSALNHRLPMWIDCHECKPIG